MHGLIFVTWEKYLAERFGVDLLNEYRTAIGETPLNALLANRVYDDEQLLAGVEAAHKLTGLPASTLLSEYGRYFITNGLTNHLCAYLLTRVHSGRELLLMMRQAHAQMSCMPGDISPPLFNYEVHPYDSHGLVLLYNSPRKLCAVLYGAIEGAAERYGETVHVVEVTCMHRGDPICRFETRFVGVKKDASLPQSGQEQQQRADAKRQLANLVLQMLPEDNYYGITLLELHKDLQSRLGKLHLIKVQEALNHLQYAGLVANSAKQSGDNLAYRRYWRVPVIKDI